MRIAVLKERAETEARVAATPDSVKRLVALGHSVSLEVGAGLDAGFTDASYTDAGGVIAKTPKATTKDADILFCVGRPDPDMIPHGLWVVGLVDPFAGDFESLNAQKANVLAMEFVPRITRAQNMDALSSQSNLAGYRAVLEACAVFGRAMPMMMTAAGTIAPAKVFVMGAGVAGLQAIATARRLGGVVTATDVRPAAKEQVASLGAKFVAVENDEFKAAETAGGYAKQMSPEYQAEQAALVASHIAKQDIVITTALIPGRPAPKLIDAAMVASMRAGSVIVDMAAAMGGNCALSEADKVVDVGGVKVLGYTNLPARIPTDASALYARNLLNFLPLITDEAGGLSIDTEDEIVSAMLVLQNGEIVHDRLKG